MPKTEIPLITIKLNEVDMRNIVFVLDSAYSEWGMMLAHHLDDGVMPAEVLEILDVLDDVRDQLVEQGMEWHE